MDPFARPTLRLDHQPALGPVMLQVTYDHRSQRSVATITPEPIPEPSSSKRWWLRLIDATPIVVAEPIAVPIADLPPVAVGQLDARFLQQIIVEQRGLRAEIRALRQDHLDRTWAARWRRLMALLRRATRWRT